ncbi:UDP-glucose 4-epimerase [Gracilariopsis chorda]|uniref:UDP-glucose 4-epimerase n=1 Tax=Gracilariopsis chorda TaxID=448386 RepID=A0A2V3ISH2_9FLOR|nr:UDP-glucose 4-epimerase [Gracilariopsis chorda]|eukprot:PXF44697.1 UDP-glucose 4-epimerase [Gracilariopsis chorda]
MNSSTSNSHAVQRIVITGGTGYIGYALLHKIRELFMDSLSPVAIVRASSDITRLQRLLDYPSEHDPVIICDLQDVESLVRGVKDADIVVHLAAEMDFFPKNKENLLSVNVDGTRNLLEACACEAESSKRNIRFVYVSSTEAIGTTDGVSKADESHALNPDSYYGYTKVLAESVVEEYRQRLDTVIVRPTGVFGPDERFFFLELMQMVAKGFTVVLPSPMTGRTCLTHIDDIVNGILACATHPKAPGNTYNLCTDEAVSGKALVQTVADVLQCPRPIFSLPPSVGGVLIRLVAPIMNMGKRRVFMYHPKTVSDSMAYREYSNAKIRRELGFKPKYTMLEGVEETCKYELEVGTIKRSTIPPAIKRCIDLAAVVLFAISQTMGRRHRHAD